jgi:antitoxin ParD1/3/4
VQALLASGRYNKASEVLRDALRLKRKLAALDAPSSAALPTSRRGRIYPADEVFDEIEAELAALPRRPAV